MYITQDVIRDSYHEIVEQIKITQILQMYPELITNKGAIKHRLKYMPSILGDDAIIIKLVDAPKDGIRDYWYNQIGQTYRMYSDSYSKGGMGMVGGYGGCSCHTMDEYKQDVIFEVIALPISMYERGE